MRRRSRRQRCSIENAECPSYVLDVCGDLTQVVRRQVDAFASQPIVASLHRTLEVGSASMSERRAHQPLAEALHLGARQRWLRVAGPRWSTRMSSRLNRWAPGANPP